MWKGLYSATIPMVFKGGPPGEKYLEEQIRSILAQEHKQLTLLIRDDGSTDRTIDIIKRYADNYENVAYYTGKNLGVQQSFFNLMKHADKTADFYAFADQDDVWMRLYRISEMR